MLAALAARTTTIRLGIMINVLPFHQPVRLAEEGAMLDVLSGGRLEFGIGRGIDFQELQKLGMTYDELRPRFEDGVELLLKAWTQQRFEHDGPYYRIGRASLYPRRYSSRTRPCGWPPRARRRSSGRPPAGSGWARSSCPRRRSGRSSTTTCRPARRPSSRDRPPRSCCSATSTWRPPTTRRVPPPNRRC